MTRRIPTASFAGFALFAGLSGCSIGAQAGQQEDVLFVEVEAPGGTQARLPCKIVGFGGTAGSQRYLIAEFLEYGSGASQYGNFRGISGAPVLDSSGRLVGAVSTAIQEAGAREFGVLPAEALDEVFLRGRLRGGSVPETVPEPDARIVRGRSVNVLSMWGDGTLGTSGHVSETRGNEAVLLAHPLDPFSPGPCCYAVFEAPVLAVVPIEDGEATSLTDIGRHLGTATYDGVFGVYAISGLDTPNVRLAIHLRSPDESLDREYFLARSREDLGLRFGFASRTALQDWYELVSATEVTVSFESDRQSVAWQEVFEADGRTLPEDIASFLEQQYGHEFLELESLDVSVRVGAAEPARVRDVPAVELSARSAERITTEYPGSGRVDVPCTVVGERVENGVRIAIARLERFSAAGADHGFFDGMEGAPASDSNGRLVGTVVGQYGSAGSVHFGIRPLAEIQRVWERAGMGSSVPAAPGPIQPGETVALCEGWGPDARTVFVGNVVERRGSLALVASDDHAPALGRVPYALVRARPLTFTSRGGRSVRLVEAMDAGDVIGTALHAENLGVVCDLSFRPEAIQVMAIASWNGGTIAESTTWVVRGSVHTESWIANTLRSFLARCDMRSGDVRMTVKSAGWRSETFELSAQERLDLAASCAAARELFQYFAGALPDSAEVRFDMD